MKMKITEIEIRVKWMVMIVEELFFLIVGMDVIVTVEMVYLICVAVVVVVVGSV